MSNIEAEMGLWTIKRKKACALFRSFLPCLIEKTDDVILLCLSSTQCLQKTMYLGLQKTSYKSYDLICLSIYLFMVEPEKSLLKFSFYKKATKIWSYLPLDFTK